MSGERKGRASDLVHHRFRTAATSNAITLDKQNQSISFHRPPHLKQTIMFGKLLGVEQGIYLMA